MKKLHLICNAHLDPIWLWEWEEGAAAALSTFRSAASLADEFDYVFCHNEVTLYKWVEEYDKETFEKIKQLIKAGKWKIIGGWYLQPDCNMPSGESFVRQIMEGREYFSEKFGVSPTTAINFDPFGHSYGLPQILKKTGYNSYLCCRPSKLEFDVCDDFIWQGVDGSRVLATRVASHYNSGLGHADKKICDVIGSSKKDTDIVLWGVGNHGGGPSREDLQKIEKLIDGSQIEIVHSYPEEYFAESDNHKTVINQGMNPCMPGCYTSQIRIKQKHRELESQLYMTEKMLSHAAAVGALDYPYDEIKEAVFDLMNAEFHDVLPGSGIKACEDYGIRLMDHGLEILNRLRAKAYFALGSGECAARDGEFPILVYNPHPYAVDTVVDVGFNLADQNYESYFNDIIAYDGEKRLKTQLIKPKCTMNFDWMKRVVFECTLKPCSINRFDCKKQILESVPKVSYVPVNDFIFDNGKMQVVISKKTGLIKSLKIHGKQYLQSGAFGLKIYNDNEDPWAMSAAQNKRMGEYLDDFKLMTGSDSSYFSGDLKSDLESVRIIEDGEVFTVVESVFSYKKSEAHIEFVLYKNKNEIDVNIDLFFMEKNKMVKLSVPFGYDGNCYNDIAFGKELINQTGTEAVMQRYIQFSGKETAAAIFNSGIYGMSVINNTVDFSLARGAVYAAHPIQNRPISPSDRFVARFDQGERNYSFKMIMGAPEEIENSVEKTACVFSQKPFSQCVFPSGGGKKPTQQIVVIDNDKISLVAFKQSKCNGYILRIANNHNFSEKAILKFLNKQIELTFTPFEVKTISFNEQKLTEEAVMFI